MRIAQVAPLYESVPPQGYGGTERVVHYLTEELVALGHEVTLFASGDSRTSARLVAGSPRSLRLDSNCRDPLVYHTIMLDRLASESKAFDVIHFHLDYLHFALSKALAWPNVTTLHGRLDLPDLQPLYEAFADMPMVSISDAQRAPIPNANWQATVGHGLPRELLSFNARRGDYFAFLGRISPEKRVDRAIRIATELKVPLKIAAKIDRADRDYYEREIAASFDNPLVEFIGEIGEQDKSEFLGNARALLFPIDWPEPFGLVMIEAMACGTPVIAFRHGSVPEILEDGVTGYLVDNLEQAVEAAGRVEKLSRFRIREEFERRFTARTMAENYLSLYRKLSSRKAYAA